MNLQGVFNSPTATVLHGPIDSEGDQYQEVSRDLTLFEDLQRVVVVCFLCGSALNHQQFFRNRNQMIHEWISHEMVTTESFQE